MIVPSLLDIQYAHIRIKNFINRTPVLTSHTLNGMTGNSLFFKCENYQKVGAFKFRGATNAVLQLNNEEKAKGVATHSSGNHAQALALAAKNNGIKATIIMPDNSPKVKINAVKGYGADIIFCKSSLEARESALNGFISDTGATFIHPYNNFNVICGQGTAALELIEEIPGLDYVITPVGGGGLLSGTATAIKGISQKTKVIAAEPEYADDAYRSFNAGELLPSVNPKTICDGLLTSLSGLTFKIITDKVDEIVTVNDKIIVNSMKLIWERMKIVVEPSSAITLALLLDNKLNIKGKRIGLIISGGNIDLDNFFDNLQNKTDALK